MSLYLGIDAGSVSLKLLVWDGQKVIWSTYKRISGSLLERLSESVIELKKEMGDVEFDGVVTVGSGREYVASKLSIPTRDEISAQITAAKELCPNVGSIIEIGGQDAKAIAFKTDGSTDFMMNDLCAAGTGAFLDQQATRLGIKVENLSEIASKSKTPLSIAARCAVFAKSDMTHHQQAGRSLSDIVSGLHKALAKGFISNVSRGLELKSPICFHGGVAANADLVSKFEDLLGMKVFVSKHYKVTGALGAAIIAEKIGNKIKISDIKKKLSNNKTIPFVKKCALKGNLKNVEPNWPKVDGLYFGIDVGSVSVKFVAIDKTGPIYYDYRYSNGDPKGTLDVMLANARDSIDKEPSGVAVTGSGRSFVSWLVNADVVPNEISAQAKAAKAICKDAEVIVEIGGQDAKFLSLGDGYLKEFKMNRTCAAGTGAFLTEQCPRLGFKSEAELSKCALNAKSSPELGARCAVFMESDLVSHQQRGFERSELAAALSRSVITNYLEKVADNSIVGKKVLFLGGVAENKAVAHALSEEVGTEVYMSKWGRYSGAIGAALIASDEKKSGSYSKSAFSWVSGKDVKSEKCDGCGHECTVWKLSNDKIFGGRCGKYDQEVKRSEPTFINKRNNLLRGKARKVEGPSVGVPTSLLFYDRFPLWKIFFEEIGVKVVLSERATIGDIPPLPADTCLPLKLLIADSKELDDKGCDCLFVPGYAVDKNRNVHCPLVLTAPVFASYGVKTPVLTPAINWDADPNAEENAFYKMAERYGVSKNASKRAWGKATRAQFEFMSKTYNLGKDFLSKESGKSFVLLGKDYNMSDSRLNSNAASILSAYLPVLTQDMIVEGVPNKDPEVKQMLWHHGREMMAAARVVAENDRLLPVIITSFGCGPDSFSLKYIKKILKDKPLLILEVDEHTSEVGIATRIEAFLDSSKINNESFANEIPNLEPEKLKRIILPYFALHSLGFAAAIKKTSLETKILPPCDDDSYGIAKKYVDGNECHPYVLLLGDVVKVANNAKEGDCYFMPPATACRLGHFGRHMQMVLKDLKSPIKASDDLMRLTKYASGPNLLAYPKMLKAAWTVMRGSDLLYQRYYQTRSRAKRIGEADVAFKEATNIIEKAVFKNSNLYEAFKKASKVLAEVEIKDVEVPKIGITGDYFTRICDYANNDLLKEISNRGFEPLMSPTFTDVSSFDAYTHVPAGINHRDFKKTFIGLSLRAMLPRIDKKLVRDIAPSYTVPLDYKRAVRELEGILPMPIHNAILGTLGAVLEQVKAGAKGIVNIITFNCTYGAIVAAFLRKLSKEKGIPSITLIYEGLKPTHNLTRLEAFLNQLKSE